MYSNDIERVLSNLNNLKDTLAFQIDRLIELSDYRIWNTEHVHPMNNPVYMTTAGIGIGVGTSELARSYEDSDGDNYHPIRTAEITEPILTVYHNGFEIDNQQAQVIKGKLYKAENAVNNQYGSPWGEFTKLTERIQKIEQFANSHEMLNWTNEKRALIELMQVALTFTVDAKSSLISYHDILSRGYDQVYNKDEDSIKWEYNIAKDKDSKKGSNFVKEDPNKNDPY